MKTPWLARALPLSFPGGTLHVIFVRIFVVIFLFFTSVPSRAQTNAPPVVEAGEDQTVFVGLSAVLEGSAEDPDGDPIVSWQWDVESWPENGDRGFFADPERPDTEFLGESSGEYVLSLVASDGTDESLADTLTITYIVQEYCRADLRPFVRGDVDGQGRLNIADPLRILLSIFRDPDAAGDCLDAADVDDDGKIRIADAIYLLGYLFQGGPAPPPPHPACARDTTHDDLECKVTASPRDCASENAIFFVIDRSGSSRSGALQIAKRWTTRMLREFSEADEFGIIFVDQGMRKFPDDALSGGWPVVACDEMKASGRTFVETMPGGSGSCPRRGLLTALDSALLSGASNKVIYYMGDGGTSCQGQTAAQYANQTLTEVSEKNTDGVTINVIASGNSINSSFLRPLAAQNGGTYTVVRE